MRLRVARRGVVAEGVSRHKVTNVRTKVPWPELVVCAGTGLEGGIVGVLLWVRT